MIRKIKKSEKGISPVISTVLLIMIVIILAVIILLWSRGFIKEKLLKFDKPVDTICSNEISLKTFVNPDGSYGFTNIGNIPIYDVDVVISGGGSSNVEHAKDYGSGESGRVDIGLSTELSTPGITGDVTEVKIIPIILGKNKDGAVKEYTCPEQSAIVVLEK